MMLVNSKARLGIGILGLCFVSGCGTTGATVRQTVQLDVHSLNRNFVAIVIEDVDIVPGGNDLYAVGVQEWGRFDTQDLSNLQGSLEDTIQSVMVGKHLDSSEKVRVSVLLRRYVVAATNHSGHVLATVDWCAAQSNGSVLYRELFYAADDVHLVGTLGGLKDTVNAAIVRRIAESSLLIASGVVAKGELPRKVPDTYESFTEVSTMLPAEMGSWILPNINGPFPVYYGDPRRAQIPWWQAEAKNVQSCKQLLASKS